MKPHESEGTDNASSQRLKRDLRDREVTTVGRDGAQGIFYKVLRDSKSGRMSRDRGADPRASTGCQKHPKQSLICKAKTFTIYTVVPFTSQEQNQSIYRIVRFILFKDRHEQNREKKNKNVGYFLHKKKFQDSNCIFCKWTKGCRWNRTPQTDMLRTIALLSLPLSLQFQEQNARRAWSKQFLYLVHTTVPNTHNSP